MIQSTQQIQGCDSTFFWLFAKSCSGNMLQNKRIRYPVSTELIVFHSLAVFRGGKEKVTDEISEYLTAVSYSLFSTLRRMEANLSCWASAHVHTMSVVWVRTVLLNSALATTHPSVWVKCLWCRGFMQLWGSFWWCTTLGCAHKNSELCGHLISGPFNTLDRLCSKSLFLMGFLVIL